RSDAPYQLGFYHAQTWIRGCQIAQMSVKQPYRLHGPEMQAPAWLPAWGIDLAVGLRSNERCQSRRIRGRAARQIRQRCSRDSNSAAANVCFRDKADIVQTRLNVCF